MLNLNPIELFFTYKYKDYKYEEKLTEIKSGDKHGNESLT